MSKILIVEDNAESRYLIERLLSSRGDHHVIAAENGEEALMLARQDPPEIIISDIMMPVMNGFKLCCEVKKDSRLRHIPFIFYTATFVDESDRKLAKSLGASRFLVKPTEEEAFIQILDDVLREQREGVLPVPEGPLEDEEVLLEMYDSTLSRKLAETVEKLQEERRALIRSEQRLKEAQELAHVGHWELNLKTDSLEWSDEIYRILGVRPQKFKASYEAFMTAVHPDDRADVKEAHKESLSKKTPSDIEYRLLLKDGTVKYVNEKFQTLYDDEGMPTCSMGTVQDITERKRTEKRLRFLSSSVEQSSEGMAFADMEGNLIYVNQAWVEMHGYGSPEELTERHLSIFHDMEQLKDEVEPFNEMVMENGYHKGEVGHIRKDGKRFPTLMTTTLIKDESGKPIALSGIAKNIADIKRAEVELKKERDTLKGLMDGLATTGIGVDIVGLNYRILYQNKVLTEAFGDISGKLCYENYMGLDTPCDPCPMALTIKSGKVERVEMTGSNDRHYEILSAPLFSPDGAIDKAIEVVFDITERRRAEEALRESEERYRALFERSIELVYLCDFEGNFVDANDAALGLLGYTKDEITSLNFGSLLDEDQHSLALETVEEILKTGSQKEVVEYKLRRKDGEYVYVESMGAIIYRDGKPFAIQGIARDITERKQSEEHRLKLEAQLQQAQKMEAIGTLAGGIAHDFNNILGAIIGHAEIGKMKLPEGSEAIDNLDQVLKAGKRAAKLVKQILTVSRQHQQEQRALQIRYIVQEVLKLLRSTLPTTIEIKEDLVKEPGIVQADPTQIHQVIMNLCTNAGHAMQKDGGVLTVELADDVKLDDIEGVRHLDMSAGSYLRLTVSDTGHGMSPEIMERIFDPYFTTKDTGEGTGLGLSVVQGIIKAHGGAITVYSEPGKGTTSHVYLPIILEEGREKKEAEEPLPTGSERILFIDDEQVLAEIGRQMLERLGYEVVTKQSSIEALELFRAESERFDLVITDMTMPHMTGDKLAQELIKIRPDIPVILCTGYSRLVSEEKAKQLGIQAFVMKPLSTRVVAETVRKVLDEK